MKRLVVFWALMISLGLTTMPQPAHAGWNGVLRFFGEFWSDGYHSKGDHWNAPTKHSQSWMAQPSYYHPSNGYPEVIEESVPTPAKQPVSVTGVASQYSR
ncbi:hypothetical protein ACYFX5_02435 [Bremerella sp. T1]|uniref:hypothetical protein n=1 Tax=Bremerella sp. TYQ1 TaxID=3119568 RepID=UPI001CCC209B|nr:hypothetical protein [Bremerella volcania]UBM37128.1 hypothetical protein LA756_04390 [Bremerella volcania]